MIKDKITLERMIFMNENNNKIPEEMLPNPVSIDNDLNPDLMGEVFKETQDNDTCECVGECTCKKGHNLGDGEENSPGLQDEYEKTCHCEGDCTCNKPKELEKETPTKTCACKDGSCKQSTQESKTCECEGDCTCNKPKEDTSKVCQCEGDCTCDKPKEEDHHHIDTGVINNPVSMDNDLHMKEAVFSSEGDETLDVKPEHEIDFEHLSQVMEHKRKEYETDTSEDEFEEDFDEQEKEDKIFLDIQTRTDR